MRNTYLTIFLLFVAPRIFADEKITYDDHIRPIFTANCVSCHNPDKATAGIDLTTYQRAMAGGSAGKVINAGEPDGSTLYLVTAHEIEPHMPKGGSKLPDAQIALLKKWVETGALESASATAVASSKPKMEMKLSAAPSAKPEGPPPMPTGLSLEPVVKGDRAGAAGSIAASPWAPLVAIAVPRQLLLYNTQSFDLLGVIPFEGSVPKVLTFSRNGALLMAAGGVGGKSGHISLYDVATGRKLVDVGEEFDEVLAADLSPDQSIVALGGPAKLLKIYSTVDGTLISKLTQHTDWITAIAFSPDGVLLASGDRNGGLRVWEANTGREFYTLNGHKAAITSVCFRADSNLLASASEDGTIKLWDMNSGGEAKSWAAHQSGVLSVNFARDGRIVSAGRDKIVRMWAADGAKIRDLEPMNEIALRAVFAQDDSRIVSSAWNGEIRVALAEDGKTVGQLDGNPPTIDERIRDLHERIPNLQKSLVAANGALQAAQTSFNAATADVQVAQSLADKPQKTLVAFRMHIGAVQASVAIRSEQLRHATQVLDRAKLAVSQSSVDLAKATEDLKKWQLAAVGSKLADAQRELEELSSHEQQLTAALQEMEVVGKLIVDAPEKIHLGEQRLASASESLASATAMSQALSVTVTTRDAALAKSKDLVENLTALAAADAQSKPIGIALQKAKEAFDLLTAEATDAHKAAAAAAEAVKISQAEVAAATAAITSAKSEQAAAPARLDAARQTISQCLTPDLKAAKSRVDQLLVERERVNAMQAP